MADPILISAEPNTLDDGNHPLSGNCMSSDAFPLSKEQTQQIRSALLTAILEGRTQEELRDLRAELKRTFKCSSAQVGSAGAWLIIPVASLLREVGILSKTSSQKETSQKASTFLRFALQASRDPDGVIVWDDAIGLRLKNLATGLGTSEDKIRDALELYKPPCDLLDGERMQPSSEPGDESLNGLVLPFASPQAISRLRDDSAEKGQPSALDERTRERIQTALIGAATSHESMESCLERASSEYECGIDDASAIALELFDAAEHALAQLKNGSLTIADLLAVEALRREFPTDQSAIFDDASRQYGVAPSEIEAAIERFRSNCKQASTTEAVIEIKEQEIRLESKSPAFTNYDFEVKRKWRSLWESFIRQRFTRKELKEATVLCLPSPYVDREVSIYLNLGIPARNIYVVEGEKQAKDLFLKNAHALGVHPLFGRLEDLAPTLSTAFTIVSLDFPGPHTLNTSTIMQNVLLADKAACLVNTLGAREDVISQEVLRMGVDLAERQHNELLVDLVSFDPGAFETWQNVSEPSNLKEIRDAGLESARALLWSRERSDKIDPEFRERLDKLFPPENFPSEFVITAQLQALHRAEQLAQLQIGVAFAQIGYTEGTLAIRDAHGSVCRTTVGMTPLLTDVVKYKYLSEASWNHRPFYSSFSIYERPTKDYRRCKETVSFIIDVVEALNTEGTSPFMQKLELKVLSPGGRRIYPPTAIELDDTIILERSGKEVASVNAGTLERDLKRFGKLMAKNVSTKKLDDQERILIEAS